MAAGRLAGGAAMGGARAASSLASGARTAYGEAAGASGETGARAMGAGLAGVARSGAKSAGDGVRSAAQRAWRGGSTGTQSPSPSGGGASDQNAEPGWARNMRHGESMRRGVETASHVIRSGDHGGAGAGPELNEES